MIGDPWLKIAQTNTPKRGPDMSPCNARAASKIPPKLSAIYANTMQQSPKITIVVDNHTNL